MTRTENDRFQRQLEHLRDRLQMDATMVAEQARGAVGGKGSGELSNVPMHLGDMGTEEYLADLNATLASNEQFLANEVQAALARMLEGTFGQCARCGQSIAKERLEAIPYTRYCIRCAELSESALPPVNLNSGRPHGPDDGRRNGNEEGKKQRRKTHNSKRREADTHAAGTAGGGTALGGLAGTNTGHGDPDVSEDDLERAMASGNFDASEDRTVPRAPKSKRSTPSGDHNGARKRRL